MKELKQKNEQMQQNQLKQSQEQGYTLDNMKASGDVSKDPAAAKPLINNEGKVSEVRFHTAHFLLMSNYNNA